MHQFIEMMTGSPLKYKMDNSIRIVSLCMGSSIGMKRVKLVLRLQHNSAA